MKFKNDTKKFWFRRSTEISAVDLFCIRWYESGKLSSAINLKNDTDAIVVTKFRILEGRTITAFDKLEKL
jgi:antitoxin component YwqK of YwqJK toxin-antitoxin module